MTEEQIRFLAENVLTAMLSNPSVVVPDPNCGWRIQNCTPPQLADFAWYVARQFNHVGQTTAGRNNVHYEG